MSYPARCSKRFECHVISMESVSRSYHFKVLIRQTSMRRSSPIQPIHHINLNPIINQDLLPNRIHPSIHPPNNILFPLLLPRHDPKHPAQALHPRLIHAFPIPTRFQPGSTRPSQQQKTSSPVPRQLRQPLRLPFNPVFPVPRRGARRFARCDACARISPRRGVCA